MKTVLKWIGIAFAAFMALGIAMAACQSPEDKEAKAAKFEQDKAKQAQEKQEKDRQEMAAIPAVSAADIAHAYSENTVAADQKFKGKRFKVSGTVVDINTDFAGDPYLTLKGGVNQFMEPHFNFDKSASEQLSKLKKGAKVSLICVGKGDVAKTPMSGSCSLI